MLRLALAFGILWTSVAWGETRPELHLVSIGTGVADGSAPPIAKVVLNRPGRHAHLVLGSEASVTWVVETREFSSVASFTLFGAGAEDSAIILNGRDVGYALRLRIGASQSIAGATFERMRDQFLTHFNFPRIDSMTTAAYAEQTLFVNEIQPIADAPHLGVDPLANVELADVPSGLRPAFDAVMNGSRSVLGAQIDKRGRLTVTRRTGDTRAIELPDGVHTLVAAAPKSDGTGAYVVGRGGGGAIYEVTFAGDRWRKILQLQNETVTGILADPNANRLILAIRVAQRDTHNLAVFDLEKSQVRLLDLLPKRSESLSSLAGPDASRDFTLLPLAVDGEALLAKLTRQPQHRRSLLSPEGSHRLYMMDLVTGDVNLVGYRNAPAFDPR